MRSYGLSEHQKEHIMNRYLVFIATALFLCGIVGIAAFQRDATKTPDGKTFRINTDLMEVRAVVADPKGRIIENLKKEDFELMENDRPQEISFFSISKLESQSKPLTAIQHIGKSKEPEIQATVTAATQDKATGMQNTNEQENKPPLRTTLLFVDNMHLTFPSLNRVKQTLRRYINEQLTDQEMVAVVASGQSLGIAQQFTRDRKILNYAVEQIRLGPIRYDDLFTPNLAAGVLAERLDTVRLAVDIVRQKGDATCCSMLRILARNRSMQLLSETSYYRKTTISTLKDFEGQMIGLPGKRMILIFSDGFSLYDSDSSIHNDQLQPAIDRAVRSGVVIYAIDAKGLQTPPTIDASKRITTANPGAHTEDSPCPGELPDEHCLPPDPGSYESFMYTSEREEQNGLFALADQTGGKLYTNHNDLNIPMQQAFDANRFYYVLSYYLQSGGDPHRFRNLKVRVRNHPEYKIQTARGYVPLDKLAKPEEEAGITSQQRLVRAVNALLPLTRLNVTAKADFIESENDDKQITLNIDFDGDRFQCREKDKRTDIGIEILTMIYSASGEQVDAISAHVEGKLTLDRVEQAKTNGYRFSRRLTLKPGVYQARVGVLEEGTDNIGTAVAWVEVPNLENDKLEMSALMLRNPLDAEQEDAEEGDLAKIKLLQGIPLYGHDAFCEYSFRVHRTVRAHTGADLVFMREVLKEGKPLKQEPWLPILKEERIVDRKGWFEVHDDMDLRGFAPGVYELRVSVKDAQSNITMQRTAVFSVE
jgi:VWFA-related protein